MKTREEPRKRHYHMRYTCFADKYVQVCAFGTKIEELVLYQPDSVLTVIFHAMVRPRTLVCMVCDLEHPRDNAELVGRRILLACPRKILSRTSYRRHSLVSRAYNALCGDFSRTSYDNCSYMLSLEHTTDMGWRIETWRGFSSTQYGYGQANYSANNPMLARITQAEQQLSGESDS